MFRKKLFFYALILLAFFLTAAAITTGSYFSSGLIVEIGEPADVVIRATGDVIDEYATEQNREEARRRAEGLHPVYTIDPLELDVVLNNLLRLRYDLENIRLNHANELASFQLLYEAWQLESDGIISRNNEQRQQWEIARDQAGEGAVVGAEPVPLEIPEAPEMLGESLEAFNLISPVFNESHQTLIVEMEENAFVIFWAVIESVAQVVQNGELIHDDITNIVLRSIQNELDGFPTDRVTDELAERIIAHNLRANAVPNEEQNRINYENELNSYDVVVVAEGTILVDIGYPVTERVYMMMLHLDMLAPESPLDNIYPLLGVLFLVFVMFFASLMYLKFYHPTISSNKKEAMLLFTLYILTIALAWTLSDVRFPLLPILIFPMLVSILLDRRASIILTFSVVFTSYFIAHGDLTFILFYTFSGILICLFSKFTTERTKVILVGVLVSVLQFALAIAIDLIVHRDFVFSNVNEVLTDAGFAALMGLLVVILCTGSLPFWETFFGVVTPIKLLDLTNPTNLLLRRLTIEAPGTYHHSLIVANLAETAAYDIGANAHAARVGGYYHDVGKLKYPHYFVENIDGENPHNHLDPINSAQLIMSHVSYGLTLATEHRMPQFVRDIIKEHHGTTLMQFFFSKAKENGSQVEEKDFRYPFVVPQSRESACVMLADSVEAAVRSMIPKMQSLDEVEKTIRFIIRGKLNDGQLVDSELSIRDVSVIEQSFFRVLKGMYHERIAYPAPKTEAKKEEK